MPATESSALISSTLTEAVRTNADSETPSLQGDISEDTYRDEWQWIIDHKFIEWGKNPEQFEDEGVESPTRDALQRAIELAKWFRDKGWPAGDSVVPDVNGGIVFERREREVSEVIHVWDDGTIEYQRFQGTQLIERQPL